MQTIKIINLGRWIVSIKISFPGYVLAGFLHKVLVSVRLEEEIRGRLQHNPQINDTSQRLIAKAGWWCTLLHVSASLTPS